MNIYQLASTWIVLSLGSGAALADSGKAAAQRELDITMTVVQEGAAPEAVIQQIALPPAAVPPASGDGSPDRAAGDQALTQGRELGAAVAADARAAAESIKDTATGLGNDAAGVVRDTIKDTIVGGGLQDIPDEVRDNLPVDVPDDILN